MVEAVVWEGFPAVVRELVELLGGTRLVAEIGRVRTTWSVRRWMKGTRTPDSMVRIRVIAAAELCRLARSMNQDPAQWLTAPSVRLRQKRPIDLLIQLPVKAAEPMLEKSLRSAVWQRHTIGSAK